MRKLPHVKNSSEKGNPTIHTHSKYWYSTNVLVPMSILIYLPFTKYEIE